MARLIPTRLVLLLGTVLFAGACADEPDLHHPTSESIVPASILVGGLNYDRVVVDPNSPLDPWVKNIAPIDGDGLPDLIVSGGRGPMVWYQAPGWTKRTISSNVNSESGSDVGDIDGDGDVDLVVGKAWFENINGGSSWAEHPLPSGSGSTHDIVVLDINGDGKLDITMRGQSQSVVTVYQQNSPTSWTVYDVQPGLGLNGLDVADVNADGRPDIVVGGVWMENPGGNPATGTWTSHTFASWNAFASVKVIDMDGDGRRDIVLSVSEEQGKLSWFKAPADPENGTWTENVVGTGLNKVHCFAVVDLNNDGQLDIAASEFEGQGRLMLYLRTSGNNFASYVLGTDALHNMRAGDIDADGDIDLFGAYCFGVTPVVLYRNTGSGGPASTPPTVATGAAASPSSVSGTTTALSVLGADDNGEPALRYNWATTGSPPGSVSFSANGTNAAKSSVATFTRAGSYTLEATITDAQNQTVRSSVGVTVTQSATSVLVTPASASVSTGGTQAFTAAVRDQFGQPLSSQPTIGWTVSGGGSISSGGVFTAGATAGGPFTVTATGSGRSGTAAVTVTSGSTGSTNFGETAVLGVDDGNNGNLLIAQQATLAQSGTLQTLSFYVTVASGQLRLGVYTASGPGSGPGTKLAETAAFTPVVGWNTVAVVTPVALNAGTYWLAYLPSSSALRFRHATSGSGRWYSYTFGTLPTTYSTSPSSGAYHWSFYGTLGTGGGPSNQAPTVATPAAAAPTTVSGSTTALSVLGADDAGQSGLNYTWATTGTPPAAVTFSANGTNAARNTTATFTRAGSYALRVTIADAQGLSVTSSVNVTVSQTLTSITVTPGSTSVATGGTTTFAAVARDQFTQPLTSTPAFAWSVSGGGTINSSGQFTAGATAGGPFTVTASSGARSGTASVTVTGGPANQSPTVATPAAASPSTVTGSSTALSARGADDAGEPALRYTWATTGTPPAAVTFSANGTNAARNTTATFTRAGSYALRVTIADAQGLSVTSSVNVTVSQTLTSVTVTPGSTSVATGGTTTFAAVARDQFTQPLTSTPAFAWSVSGGGTINSSGQFTAGATAGGPFTVTATTGARSGSAAVTVTGGGSSFTIGESAILSEGDGNNGGLLVAQQTTLAQAATLQTLSFYVDQTAGRLRLGIYSANGAGGGPGTKLAETAEFTPVTGWNTVGVQAPASLPAGTYWLAYLSNTNDLRFRMARNGNGRWNAVTFGAMPTTFPAQASSGAYHWSFYATLQ